MTVAVVKEKLHKYIDQADNKKVQALYTYVATEMEHQNDIFDDEMMTVLNERRNDYLSGKSKTFTLEQSMKNISEYRKKLKNGL